MFLTLKLYLHSTELLYIELFGYLTVCKQNLYLYKTELVELELFEWTELLEREMFFTINLNSWWIEMLKIELIIYIKIDLALNNLQGVDMP